MNLRPENFEAGDNVTDQVLRRNRPHGMVVSVRLTPEDAARLIALAENSGKTVSQVAQQAMCMFIAEKPEVMVQLCEAASAYLQAQLEWSKLADASASQKPIVLAKLALDIATMEYDA